MKRYAIVGLGALLMSGCTADPIRFETPVEMIGVVSNPTTTGWYKNYCDGGRLTTSLPDCVQVGGEIYRVSLLDVRTPEGRRISHKLIIGFPAHALPSDYRDEKRMRLEKAPADFRNATGIEFLVSVWSDT